MLCSKLSLLFANSLKIQRNAISTCVNPLCVQFTPILFAEPLKKKKRLDPSIIKAREDRKKRKLEKAIRKLERNSQQLKPLDECEIPFELLYEKDTRKRANKPLTEEILDERVLTMKNWNSYKNKRYISDVQMMDRIMSSQIRALQELRKESEELYQAAIQIDEELLPFNCKCTVETPPIENYDSPDGEYYDISKKWDGTDHK